MSGVNLTGKAGTMLPRLVHFRIPRELTVKLDALAKARLLSRSDIVREALLEYIRAHVPAQPKEAEVAA